MNSPGRENALFEDAEARRLAWLLGVLLVVAACAANARVAGFEFLYLRDDDINVTLNPHMGRLTAGRIGWMFGDWSYARRYMPLGWLGFAATFQFAGLDPGPYHVVGLLLHAANTALVFAVAALVVRLFSPGAVGRGLSAWEVACAALAAAWWSQSPLRVETTAWVSGNLYGQAAALALVSAAAYLRSRLGGAGGRAGWTALSAAAYLASLLTYPIALGLPFAFAGIDILLLRRPGSPSARRLAAEKALFLAPLAAALAVTITARMQDTLYGQPAVLRGAGALARAAQASYVALYYLWKPWWPLHLSPLYDTLYDFNPLGPVFAASMAVFAAVTVVALARLRTRPALAVVWFAYLALAAPYFGLTEARHMASDRYACLLTVLPAALLALAAARVRPPPARVAVAAAGAAAAAALAALTWNQLGIWRSDRIQHRAVLPGLVNPGLRDDFKSRMLILDFMRGDEADSGAAVEAWLRDHPSSGGFRTAMGIIAEKRRIASYYGRVGYLAILQEQEALQFARAGELFEADEHFKEALRLDGRFYQAAFDRALVLLQLGRSDEALRCFLQAERWAPGPLPTGESRGFVYGLERLADLEGDGRLAKAAARALER